MTIILKTNLSDRISITSPEVGSPGEIRNLSFATGLDGKGLNASRAGAYVSFPIDNLDINRTRIEFDYKPRYSATANITDPVKTLIAINTNTGFGSIKLSFSDRVLSLSVETNRGILTASTPQGVALWGVNTWVKLAVEWNTDKDDSVALYLNGVKMSTQTISGGWSVLLPENSKLFLGGLNAVRNEMAEGIIDNLVVNSLDPVEQISDLERIRLDIQGLSQEELIQFEQELLEMFPDLCGSVEPDPIPDPIPDPEPDPIPDPEPDPIPDPEPDPIPTGDLNLLLSVKETSGTNLSGHPVQVVVPLPYGQFHNVPQLSANLGGQEVPVQCDVLNRHWAKDNSIRHIVARFQATLSANSSVSATLRTVSSSLSPTDPIIITETASAVNLTTAGKTYIIEKSPFKLIMPTGEVSCSFMDRDNSPVNLFSENVVVSVEERGPLYSCVKVKGRSWAIRLYVFAGKPYVKLDFQLQNAYGDVVWSEARVFQSLSLSVPGGTGGGLTQTVTAGPPTAYPTSNDGYASNGRAWIAMRNFREMWPNKLSASPSLLTAELWPAEFSQQLAGGTSASPTGLYWLDDMQCVVKEMFIGFEHETAEIARKIQRHPICSLPVSWYKTTKVTFDMDGQVPDVSINETHSNNPNYAVYSNQNGYYRGIEKLGWNFFGCDMARKLAPGMAGHWPYSVNKFLLSGNPADYWFGLDLAMAELNCHPQWLFDYNHATDWNTMRPTSDPYGGFSWRRWNGHGTYGSNQIPGYPAGATQQAKPRDDAHGWFYQVEEAYYFTANPWIKDWYKWIGEFRKTRLNEQDVWPDKTGRAMGHSIAHALQAYRVCGDVSILTLVNSYVRDYIQIYIQANGAFVNRPYDTGAAEAIFQIGYLTHALITAYHETNDQSMKDRMYAVVEGFVRWNLTNSRFGYYNSPNGQLTNADGSSMTFADPQAWVVMNPTTSPAIRDAARQQIADFMDGRIGSPQSGVQNTPYVNLRNWQGDYNGRLVTLLGEILGGNL